MIHVVAMITAQPGRREAILEAFHANVPLVHAEPGCIEYQPVVDAGFGDFATPLGSDSFMVIEKWSSEQALAAHAASPHMVAYGAKVKDLVAERAVYVLSSTQA